MFNKKEMKLITDYKKVQQYLMKGVSVYMVQLDGSLVEVTEETDWRILFFHNLKQGNYAIYRKKFTGVGEFYKDIHIGKRTITVEHTKEGGGASWRFASCRKNQ